MAKKRKFAQKTKISGKRIKKPPEPKVEEKRTYDFSSPFPPWARIYHLAFVATIFIFWFLLLYSPIRDTDMWWHLREGEAFLKQGITDQDRFTYTMKGKWWVNHAWLTDICFYLLYSNFGPTGLITFRIIAFLTIITLIFTLYYRNKVPLAIPAVFLIVVVYIIMGRFLIRPHIVSYLLLTIITFIVLEGGPRWHKWMYIIIGIQWLWANTHAGFMLGLIVQTAFLVGDYVQWKFSDIFPSLNRDWFSNEHFKRWGMILVIGFMLSAFITPFGFDGMRIPMGVIPLFGKVLAPEAEAQKVLIQQNTTEWFSPFNPFFKNSNFFFYYKYWCIFFFLMLALSYRKIRFCFAFTTIGLFYLSLQSHRFRVDLTIHSCMLLAFILPHVWAQYKDWLGEMIAKTREVWKWFLVVSCITLVIIMTVLIFARANSRYVKLELGISDSLPKHLVPFLEKWDIHGRMWNDLMFGGWLLWWWREPVFIDGRNFNYEVYWDYLQMQHSAENLQHVLDKYEIDHCISRYPLSMNDAILQMNINLMKTGDWYLVYWDQVVLVYVKNIPKFKEVIQNCTQQVVHPFDGKLSFLERKDYAKLALRDVLVMLRENPENSKAAMIRDRILQQWPDVAAEMMQR